MRSTGNTILITGGGSGIGRELAREFHALGNSVIITGRRRAPLDDMVAAHPGMAALVLDMEDAAAIAAFGAQVTVDHPALNIVIHNAGVMVVEAGIALPTAETTIATNLLGPIRLTAALLPHLKAQGQAGAQPAIVTVSSGLAFVPLVATPTYSATKAAIHSWSVSMREQLRSSAIEVVELVPPGVQTDLMPGHAVDPNAMPLADFIAETMGLFQQQPTLDEICVQRVGFLRGAESRGEFASVLATLNQLG